MVNTGLSFSRVCVPLLVQTVNRIIKLDTNVHISVWSIKSCLLSGFPE